MKKKYVPLQVFAMIWSLMTVFPLAFTIFSSMKTTREIFKNPFSMPKEFTVENFTTAINQGAVHLAIFNSFYLAAVSVFFVLCATSLGAFIIARKKGKIYNALYTYFLAGLLIPVHCTFIPLIRMVSSLNGSNSHPVLILIYVSMNLPLSFLLICGYMRGISNELAEAAIIDGCGQFRLFWQIFLPLCMPVLATCSIIVFLAVYNDLIFAILFITDKPLYPIALALNTFKAQYATDYGAIFAAVVLAIGPLLIIYAILQERIIEGMCAGSVKG